MIDDGSHRPTCATFGCVPARCERVLARLRPRPIQANDRRALRREHAAFTRLADGLNHAERSRGLPADASTGREAVHFYRQPGVRRARPNDDGSNVLRENVAADWIVGSAGRQPREASGTKSRRAAPR